MPGRNGTEQLPIQPAATLENQVTKILIEGQENSLFSLAKTRDLLVRQTCMVFR